MNNLRNYHFPVQGEILSPKLKIYELRTPADVNDLPPIYRNAVGRWVVSIAVTNFPLYGTVADRQQFRARVLPEIETRLRNHPNF